MNEFDLIKQFFNRSPASGDLGVGDDCSLFLPDAGMQLATSVDMLVEGQHFFSDVDPYLLGHKALAVNLSDLGAMGAVPRACWLALSLPSVQTDWLAAFSAGFFRLAQQANCPLLGGDTTRSPQGIVISITVMGQLPVGQGLLRSAAQPGDDIWVTGQLGAADIALRLLQEQLSPNPDLLAQCRPALEEPWPPYQFGAALTGVAHAAIDVSDGLVQDLHHILLASDCGGQIDVRELPIAPALRGLPAPLIEQAVLTGGDLFELCFTAAPARREQILGLAHRHAVSVSRIGRVQAGAGLYLFDGSSTRPAPERGGFDHFAPVGSTHG